MNYYELLKKEEVPFEEWMELRSAILRRLLKAPHVDDETGYAACDAVEDLLISREQRAQILQGAESKHTTLEDRNAYCRTAILNAARRGASNWQKERSPNFANVVRQLTDFHLPALRKAGVLQSAPLGKSNVLLWGLSSWGAPWRRRPEGMPLENVATCLPHRLIREFPIRYQEVFPSLIPEILESYGAAMNAYAIAEVIRDLCTVRLDGSPGLSQGSYPDPQHSALSKDTVAALRNRLQHERQRVVLDKLLEGQSAAEIAVELQCSVRTIQGDQQAIRALRAHLF